MTEDEAKTKWCPLMFGRGADLPPGPCVGSDCMAFVVRKVTMTETKDGITTDVNRIDDCHCGLVQQVW